MVATFPFYTWHHSVVVPKGHALEKTRPLTLDAIAEWPILTYNELFAGRANIDETFEKAGLFPDIVMSAMDIEVIKTYVEYGLGIGIIAGTAFDQKRDAKLRLLDGSICSKATPCALPFAAEATCGTTFTASSSCAPRRSTRQ